MQIQVFNLKPFCTIRQCSYMQIQVSNLKPLCTIRQCSYMQIQVFNLKALCTIRQCSYMQIQVFNFEPLCTIRQCSYMPIQVFNLEPSWQIFFLYFIFCDMKIIKTFWRVGSISSPPGYSLELDLESIYTRTRRRCPFNHFYKG